MLSFFIAKNDFLYVKHRTKTMGTDIDYATSIHNYLDTYAGPCRNAKEFINHARIISLFSMDVSYEQVR